VAARRKKRHRRASRRRRRPSPAPPTPHRPPARSIAPPMLPIVHVGAETQHGYGSQERTSTSAHRANGAPLASRHGDLRSLHSLLSRTGGAAGAPCLQGREVLFSGCRGGPAVFATGGPAGQARAFAPLISLSLPQTHFRPPQLPPLPPSPHPPPPTPLRCPNHSAPSGHRSPAPARRLASPQLFAP
jgi:hypothetical protein